MGTDAILKRLLELHPKIIDLTLGRIERLLDALGRPQDRLPPVVHVAGTNGKGSTIAFLRAMLEARGDRVHVYTSPHLVAFRERIRLAGELVSATKLNAALEHCEHVNDGRSITYFEITTAAAFVLFAAQPADILLLEVGLGGRLDATNVIAKPLGTIITPVSIDHSQYLGTSLSAIAREKAGILKAGVPAIIGRQRPPALAAIAHRAAALGVAPLVAGTDFDGYAQGGRLVFQDDMGLIDLPLPRLLGPHQIDNAALAVMAMRTLKPETGEAALAKGIRTAQWPGRLTHLNGALRDMLPEAHELWLDGGHNRAAAEMLARATGELDRQRPAPLVLIVGMMAGKDVAGFLAAFKGQVREVLTVPIPGEANAAKAAGLSAVAKAQGFRARSMGSLKAALAAAAKIAGARVVICGSLYLAGQALAQNKTPPV